MLLQTCATGCARVLKLLLISVLLFAAWAIGYAIPRFLIKTSDTPAVVVAGITCTATAVLVGVWLYRTEAAAARAALISADDLYIEASVLSDADIGNEV